MTKMRSTEEMLNLILNTAKECKSIRAVIMNGSRANPKVEGDIFQDFDIIYVVSELDSFTSDHSWIKVFGELLILQMPDKMGDEVTGNEEEFAYLMQFADGNRIDLTLISLQKYKNRIHDSLSLLLLDKDNVIPDFPPANESSYFPKPPTEKEFYECCNEFWWVSTYVAKGLWREELIYAKHMLDQVVRKQLMIALNWYFGIKTNFALNPGKLGTNFKQALEPETLELLEKTYANADFQDTWNALDKMGLLFRKITKVIGEHFNFTYPAEEDEKVSEHLKHVRTLPKDAKAMY